MSPIAPLAGVGRDKPKMLTFQRLFTTETLGVRRIGQDLPTAGQGDRALACRSTKFAAKAKQIISFSAGW
jgi:hypothetical protein